MKKLAPHLFDSTTGPRQIYRRNGPITSKLAADKVRPNPGREAVIRQLKRRGKLTDEQIELCHREERLFRMLTGQRLRTARCHLARDGKVKLAGFVENSRKRTVQLWKLA